MHDFTIWNTWYMNTLIEANNKILLVGIILHDKLNSDNFKRLLCMLQNLNVRSYISEKVIHADFPGFRSSSSKRLYPKYFTVNFAYNLKMV